MYFGVITRSWHELDEMVYAVSSHGYESLACQGVGYLLSTYLVVDQVWELVSIGLSLMD